MNGDRTLHRTPEQSDFVYFSNVQTLHCPNRTFPLLPLERQEEGFLVSVVLLTFDANLAFPQGVGSTLLMAENGEEKKQHSILV